MPVRPEKQSVSLRRLCTAAVTGRVFVAQTPEQFTYDADGNMLTDGRFRYTWNAENRLIRAQELVAPTNRNPYTIAYAYDHKGRMVSKRITENDGQDSLVKSITYLWDGWNIIRETQWPVASGQWPVVTDNIWGFDLNGTLQGAGGVGGLLAVVRDGETYLPTYDANGNVSEYVSTDGSIVAHYDYSPFGETLIETGDLAATFTHRFSTKLWCPVTGLCEYQMRKYRPGIGRWLSRDPMGESDSANLLAFVANQFNAIDRFGLALIQIIAPKPETIRPLFAADNDPKKSRTEYVNEAVDMRCQCVTNKWQLLCQLSYDVRIYISKKQAQDLGVTLSGIYGHEQRHVMSRELVVRHRVGDLYLNHDSPEFFPSRKECEEEIRKNKTMVLFWLKQSLHYPGNHEGDGPEYSNHLSPKASTEYPLLKDTPKWKELK